MSGSTKPNLFIIGAPKCGTTSLHAILAQHPQVFMTRLKEPRFFSMDSRWEKGIKWYLNKYFQYAHAYPIRGESTPSNLFWYEKTIPRIKQLLGQDSAKFIILLRNPIERAYSHYWYNVQTKVAHTEPLDFEGALEAESSRTQITEYLRDGVLSYFYVKTGQYADQVSAFQKAFGANNVQVLLFEDLFSERYDHLINQVEAFLGISRTPLPIIKDNASHRFKNRSIQMIIRFIKPVREVMNPYLPKSMLKLLRGKLIEGNKESFKYPPMKAETRQKLAAKFKQSNLDLQNLIGRDLSHWV